MHVSLVPRTRSSHDFTAGTVANFGFKSGTGIIELLVSFSIPKFAQTPRRILASFGIGTLRRVRPGSRGRAEGGPARPIRIVLRIVDLRR
jgi:hypothetical protein